jgi:hypothetical protein
LTGGTGGGSRSAFIRVASGGVCGDRGGARLTYAYLAARPCSRCLDGFARSVIARVLRLEVREHVLGAVGGPERQRPVVPRVELHSYPSFDIVGNIFAGLVPACTVRPRTSSRRSGRNPYAPQIDKLID